MSELHLLVVFDTETKTFRVAGMDEAPVDSDEAVWEADNDEWRAPTRDEIDLLIEAEDRLNRMIASEGIDP
jgi:hypothetical protein